MKCAVEPAAEWGALEAPTSVPWYKRQSIRILDTGNTLQLICSCFGQDEAIISPCNRCHDAQSEFIIFVKGSTTPLNHVEPLAGMCALCHMPLSGHPKVQNNAHSLGSCECLFCSPFCLFWSPLCIINSVSKLFP